MSDYLLMAVAGAMLLIAVALVWLLREHEKLKKEHGLLADQLRRNIEDVAGLCSAAVAVDQRLVANDARLDGIMDMVNADRRPSPPPAGLPGNREPEEDDGDARGYDNAIQKIRRGADVDDLVRDCSLTRDEAVLLIRLHGGKR